MSIRNPSCCTVFHIHVLKGFVSIRFPKLSQILSSQRFCTEVLPCSNLLDLIPVQQTQDSVSKLKTVSSNLTTVLVLQAHDSSRLVKPLSRSIVFQSHQCHIPMLKGANLSTHEHPKPLLLHCIPYSCAQGFRDHSPSQSFRNHSSSQRLTTSSANLG